MTQAQLIEGITEDVTHQVQQHYAGQKLRVYVEPEEAEDLSAGLPDPPDTIRDKAHLLELLQEGMQGEPETLRQEEWAEIRQEVQRRLARAKQ